MDRTVGLFLAHRLQLWPASEFVVKKLGRLQRHMIARALGLFKLPTDSFQTHFKRCSREARAHVGSTMSDWSASWIRATAQWDDHMSRDWLWQSRFFEEHPQSRSSISKRFSGFQMLQVKSIYATSFSWAAALSRFRTSDLSLRDACCRRPLAATLLVLKPEA